MTTKAVITTEAEAKAAGLPVFKFSIAPTECKAYKAADGTRTCKLVASSNANDLVGDAMSQKALRQMESSAKGTTVFLNHKYTIPEDVFGSVKGATLQKMMVDGEDGEVLCLVFDIDVAEANPRAVKTHELMLEEKSKLGASVTVLVLDATERKDGTRILDDVAYLEVSVVGIPCNRQSWVMAASKAISEIKSASDADETETAPASDPDPAAALGDPAPVSAAAPDPHANILSTESPSGRALIRSVDEMVEAAFERRRYELHASNLSGSARLPLAARDALWDPTAARKHLQGKKTDPHKAEKAGFPYKRGHIFFDPAQPDRAESYRFPFADVIDGEQKAVPRAIYALAGLVQSKSDLLTDDDRETLKARVESYYARMADEFEDATIVAPWNRKMVDGPSLLHGELLVRSLAVETVTLTACPECTEKSIEHSLDAAQTCSACSKQWTDPVVSKGMYLDELDARGFPSYVLWDVFMDCVYDLWWQVYLSEDDDTKAALTGELNLIIDEFAAVLKVNAPKWIGLYEKPEGEVETKALFKAAAANLSVGVSNLIVGVVSKIGARNSSNDQSLIDSIHGASVSLGASCGGEEKSFTPTVEQKEFLTQIASLAGTSEKTAPLVKRLSALAEGQAATTPEVANKDLIEQLASAGDALAKTLEEVATLKSQLEAAQKSVDDLTTDRDNWKAVSLVAHTALEAVGNLPLPRIGARA